MGKRRKKMNSIIKIDNFFFILKEKWTKNQEKQKLGKTSSGQFVQ